MAHLISSHLTSNEQCIRALLLQSSSSKKKNICKIILPYPAPGSGLSDVRG